MLTIDIQSDIDAAIRDTGDFFRRQIPFVMDNAINNTARDVQRRLEGSTIPGGWTTRNKSLAKAMTRFIPDESGQAGLLNSRSKPNKRSIVIGPVVGKNGYLAGEGFAERQATGATKIPKRDHVVYPQLGPGLKRLSGGSVPERKKPKNALNTDKFFIKGSAIYERMGRKGDRLRYRYALMTSAKGTKNLSRFYPDAFETVDRVFSGHFETAVNRAIATSRFNK